MFGAFVFFVGVFWYGRSYEEHAFSSLPTLLNTIYSFKQELNWFKRYYYVKCLFIYMCASVYVGKCVRVCVGGGGVHMYVCAFTAHFLCLFQQVLSYESSLLNCHLRFIVYDLCFVCLLWISYSLLPWCGILIDCENTHSRVQNSLTSGCTNILQGPGVRLSLAPVASWFCMEVMEIGTGGHSHQE